MPDLAQKMLEKLEASLLYGKFLFKSIFGF